MAISSDSDGPVTAGPVPVVKSRSVAIRVSPRMRRADGGGGAGEVQRGEHPLDRDGARQAERAADVLVMDHPVGERDPAAEPGGEPTGLQMVHDPGEQVVGARRRRRRRRR